MQHPVEEIQRRDSRAKAQQYTLAAFESSAPELAIMETSPTGSSPPLAATAAAPPAAAAEALLRPKAKPAVSLMESLSFRESRL